MCFNRNLHEHFQVLRGQKMVYLGRSHSENEFYCPHEDGYRPTEKARGFGTRRAIEMDGKPDSSDQSNFNDNKFDKNYYDGKFVVLIHDRKTGGVLSSCSQGAEYTNGEPIFANTPKQMNFNLDKSWWKFKNQMLRFHDFPANYSAPEDIPFHYSKPVHILVYEDERLDKYNPMDGR